MKCQCGKECGVRVWCEECEAKANRRINVIKAELIYKRKRFEKKSNKIECGTNRPQINKKEV